MKLLRRLSIMLIAGALVFFNCKYQVYAYSNEIQQSSRDYFYFVNDNGQKMNSNGSFVFSYGYTMTSDYFRPTSSSISMMIRANSSSTSDTTYNVSVYKKGPNGNDTLVKTVSLNANGQYQYVNISGVTAGASYYLQFSKPLFSSASFSGDGQLYGVSVP